MECFKSDFDKRAKKDLERFNEINNKSETKNFPWLNFENQENCEETPENLENSEKLWKSSVHSSSRTISSEPSHNLNKTAELFESHLPENHVEYLLILLAGIKSTQLQKLTDTLKKIAILLTQYQEITTEFKNTITPLMKRKLLRIGKTVEKLVNSEILTLYDCYLDDIFRELIQKLNKEIREVKVIGGVIKSQKEQLKEKNSKEINLNVNKLEIGDSEKEGYYDAYKRLTSFTID